MPHFTSRPRKPMSSAMRSALAADVAAKALDIPSSPVSVHLARCPSFVASTLSLGHEGIAGGCPFKDSCAPPCTIAPALLDVTPGAVFFCVSPAQTVHIHGRTQQPKATCCADSARLGRAPRHDGSAPPTRSTSWASVDRDTAQGPIPSCPPNASCWLARAQPGCHASSAP
jgi:hypothetical protein